MGALFTHGLNPPLIVSIIVLAAVYGFGDRFTGGGWPKLDAKLPGRSVFWAGVLAALVGGLIGGWPLAALGVLWAAYRSVAMKGATTDWKKAIGRHFWYPPIVFGLATASGHSGLHVIIPIIAYFAVCVCLTAYYSEVEDDMTVISLTINSAGRSSMSIDKKMSRINSMVELARGASHGAAAGIAFHVFQ